MDVEVVVSRHIEAGDPDTEAFEELYFELELIRYVVEDLALVVRSYDEDPDHAYLLRFEDAHRRMLRGLTREDLTTPLVRLAVAHLRRSGRTTVRWITADGYEDVP